MLSHLQSMIRRPLQRSSVPDLLARPSSLKETACRHEACRLLALGLKIFRFTGTQGTATKATGVPTRCDQVRLVPTSCDQLRPVATSLDQLGAPLQTVLVLGSELNASIPGLSVPSWNLPAQPSSLVHQP